MHYAFALSYKLTGFAISSNMAMIKLPLFFGYVWLGKTQGKIWRPLLVRMHPCKGLMKMEEHFSLNLPTPTNN